MKSGTSRCFIDSPVLCLILRRWRKLSRDSLNHIDRDGITQTLITLSGGDRIGRPIGTATGLCEARWERLQDLRLFLCQAPDTPVSGDDVRGLRCLDGWAEGGGQVSIPSKVAGRNEDFRCWLLIAARLIILALCSDERKYLRSGFGAKMRDQVEAVAVLGHAEV